jgi:hypothetical protein
MALVPDAAEPAEHVALPRGRRPAGRVNAIELAAPKPPPPSRGKPGPIGHVVTPTQRRLVQHWVAAGLSQHKIAGLMGITAMTLQKHYRYELDHGEEIANANVAANLYRIACSNAPSAAGAAQYWLNKRSDKFREAPRRVELTGKNGAPVAVASANLTLDPRRLSSDQRDALREILLAAAGDVGDEDRVVDQDGDSGLVDDTPDNDAEHVAALEREADVDRAALTADDWPGDAAGETRGVDDPAGENQTSGFE